MQLFRLLLLVFVVILSSYTAIVISQHGWGLIPVFFGDMVAMNWPGQFNLDFMLFLILSSVWVSWRHRFSAAGLALGSAAFFGGMLFLSIYLLVVTKLSSGNVEEVLLGVERARARS